MCSSVLKREHNKLISGPKGIPHREQNKWVPSFAEPGEKAPAVICPVPRSAKLESGKKNGTKCAVAG